ncbi:MAG: hypothetical protein ACLPYZ_02955 [Limisphaerales bacterium]
MASVCFTDRMMTWKAYLHAEVFVFNFLCFVSFVSFCSTAVFRFIAQNPKNCPLFQNLIRCANCAFGDEIDLMLKHAPSQLAEAVAAYRAQKTCGTVDS